MASGWVGGWWESACLGEPIYPTESVRNLGVWFDSKFSFSKHVQNVFKDCFIQLRDFRNIRQFLTHDASVSVANAFVSSRLDYCNFRSLSKFNLHRLQSIQNSAGRIVTSSSKYTRITPVLRKLHWLSIQFRSEFKFATLVYKFIHIGFPKYFALYLSRYWTTYNTGCSQSVANFLNVPKFQPIIHKSTRQFGFSFAFDAPSVWNSLPEDIRASPTIASFGKKLKTYLYAKAYPSLLIFCYGFSVVLTYFCPWTLNLDIAVVLLRLRVHYSVEIKCCKSPIRIRIELSELYLRNCEV